MHMLHADGMTCIHECISSSLQPQSRSHDVWNGACESACQRKSTLPASAGFARLVKRLYTLSCMSIDSDSVIVLPRFGGDFSGEERGRDVAGEVESAGGCAALTGGAYCAEKHSRDSE